MSLVRRRSVWLLVLGATTAGALLIALRATQAQTLAPERVHAALETYADIAWATYSDAARTGQACQEAIAALLRTPTPQTLAQAREAWLRARVPYQQSEVFRFYGGPIDRVEFLINTWPIDESYIESEDATRPGIIDDVTHHPELTRDLLQRLNGREGETSISTGYHAIEFLLWGRDTSELGPGDRSASAFDEHADPHAARRRRYLTLASELLARQLADLAAAWAPGTDNYRAQLLAAPPTLALARVLKGMGALSGPELAGERLTVAYETRDQENEHSCFSDSTDRDLLHDALGIENVCLGRYQRQDGSRVVGLGVCTLLAEHGSVLRTRITESVAAARALPAPFDRALTADDSDPGRQAIAHAITAFEAVAASLTQIAGALALSDTAVR